MEHFDLCVIGSGTGNSIIDEAFADKKVALVEKSEIFGGTCLNRGCIPTKMYVKPADVAVAAAEAGRLGLTPATLTADWDAIRDRIFGRIDAISAGGLDYREGLDNVTVFHGEARFTGPRQLKVGDQEFTADQVVIATGSSSVVPDWINEDHAEALAGLVHTSDSIMRIDELPRQLIIVGGGYVGAEFAHIFSGLGVDVTMIHRGDLLLRGQDEAVRERFTELLGKRVRIHLGQQVTGLVPGGDDDVAGGVRVLTTDDDEVEYDYDADLVLVAVGREPNLDLDLDKAGVEVAEGRIRVDAYQRTSADGVWALGDVSSPWMLKHVANHEGRIVHHNITHPDDLEPADHRFVPAAVFSDPQVASVGLTEQQARREGYDVVTGTTDYAATAYGWALEDEGHFCKLVGDRDGRLLGGHIIGPDASMLIQPIIEALSFDLPLRRLARGQYWIHPALTEVVENALLALQEASAEPRS